MKGTIFNIQRFSIHDGPGIRTTVFLKGCSLRCFWCHNPEGVRRQPELEVYPELCIGCGACLEACPEHTHSLVEGEKRFDRRLCKGCGACAGECFTDALVLVGKEMSVEEVLTEILADKPFYEKSGGGVTLSGGEPLLQLEFSTALLDACRRENIHTAVETAGNVRWEHIEGLLPFLDLIMMDLKQMDSEKHCRVTGVPNERILDTARRLAETELPLIFRTPVIPTVNDLPEEIEAIAQFVKKLRSIRGGDSASISLELLPFHPLAGDKYRGLDMENRAGDLQQLPEERMEQFRDLVDRVLSQ